MRKLIIALHLLLLVTLFSNPKAWSPHLKTKMALHLKHAPPATVLPSIKKPIVNAPSTPIKKTTKKPETKKTLKPQPLSPIKTQKKQEEKTKEKETIAKIEEKIDKLDQITKEEIKHISAEASLQNIAADASSFSSEVTSYLFQILELPGPGQVTVEIFLDRTGTIEKVVVIDSENFDNSEYLIRTLINLRLPFEKKDSVPPSLKVCFSHLQT